MKIATFILAVQLVCWSSTASATWAWRPAEAAHEKLMMMDLTVKAQGDEFPQESQGRAFRSIMRDIPGFDIPPSSSQTKPEMIMDLLKKTIDSVGRQDFSSAKKYCKEIVMRCEVKGRILNEENKDVSYDPFTYDAYVENIDLNGPAQALLILADIFRQEGAQEEAAVLYREIISHYGASFVYDTR